MTDLTTKRCQPCTGETPALKPAEIFRLRESVPEWSVTSGHKLVRTIEFDSFPRAIDFVARVAEVAEAEDHHPSITIDFRKVTFTIWTHAIDDLSENDFILAAKVDAALTGGE